MKSLRDEIPLRGVMEADFITEAEASISSEHSEDFIDMSGVLCYNHANESISHKVAYF